MLEKISLRMCVLAGHMSPPPPSWLWLDTPPPSSIATPTSLLCLGIIIGPASLLQLFSEVGLLQFTWIADHELFGEVLRNSIQEIRNLVFVWAEIKGKHIGNFPTRHTHYTQFVLLVIIIIIGYSKWEV